MVSLLVPAGDGGPLEILAAALLGDLFAQLLQLARLLRSVLLRLPQPLLVLHAPWVPCLLVLRARHSMAVRQL